MKRVRIKLVKSTIKCIPVHRRTVRALGLRKINSVTEKDWTPALEGMVKQVGYLLDVEEIQKA